MLSKLIWGIISNSTGNIRIWITRTGHSLNFRVHYKSINQIQIMTFENQIAEIEIIKYYCRQNKVNIQHHIRNM